MDENPNFRTPGTLLIPSAMGRLAGEQEPDEKNCPVHAPSIHGAFVEADSLWPAGIVFGSCTFGVLVRVLGLLALGHELLVLDFW